MSNDKKGSCTRFFYMKVIKYHMGTISFTRALPLSKLLSSCVQLTVSSQVGDELFCQMKQNKFLNGVPDTHRMIGAQQKMLMVYTAFHCYKNWLDRHQQVVFIFFIFT